MMYFMKTDRSSASSEHENRQSLSSERNFRDIQFVSLNNYPKQINPKPLSNERPKSTIPSRPNSYIESSIANSVDSSLIDKMKSVKDKYFSKTRDIDPYNTNKQPYTDSLAYSALSSDFLSNHTNLTSKTQTDKSSKYELGASQNWNKLIIPEVFSQTQGVPYRDMPQNMASPQFNIQPQLVDFQKKPEASVNVIAQKYGPPTVSSGLVQRNMNILAQSYDNSQPQYSHSSFTNDFRILRTHENPIIETQESENSYSKPFELEAPKPQNQNQNQVHHQPLYQNQIQPNFNQRNYDTLSRLTEELSEIGSERFESAPDEIGLRVFRLAILVTRTHSKNLNYNFQYWKARCSSSKFKDYPIPYSGHNYIRKCESKEYDRPDTLSTRASANLKPYMSYQYAVDRISKFQKSISILEQFMQKNSKRAFRLLEKFASEDRIHSETEIYMGVLLFSRTMNNKMKLQKFQILSFFKQLMAVTLQKEADAQQTSQIIQDLTDERDQLLFAITKKQNDRPSVKANPPLPSTPRSSRQDYFSQDNIDEDRITPAPITPKQQVQSQSRKVAHTPQSQQILPQRILPSSQSRSNNHSPLSQVGMIHTQQTSRSPKTPNIFESKGDTRELKPGEIDEEIRKKNMDLYQNLKKIYMKEIISKENKPEKTNRKDRDRHKQKHNVHPAVASYPIQSSDKGRVFTLAGDSPSPQSTNLVQKKEVTPFIRNQLIDENLLTPIRPRDKQRNSPTPKREKPLKSSRHMDGGTQRHHHENHERKVLKELQNPNEFSPLISERSLHNFIPPTLKESDVELFYTDRNFNASKNFQNNQFGYSTDRLGLTGRNEFSQTGKMNSNSNSNSNYLVEHASNRFKEMLDKNQKPHDSNKSQLYLNALNYYKNIGANSGFSYPFNA